MEELKVDKVVICEQGKDSYNYEKFKRIVKEKKIKVIAVKKGDELLIEKEVNFQILWPKEEQIGENILNNNSIVAKLNYRNFSMLFTGDIEEIAEKQILNEYQNTNILNSTILKVRTSWIKDINNWWISKSSISKDSFNWSAEKTTHLDIQVSRQ